MHNNIAYNMSGFGLHLALFFIIQLARLTGFSKTVDLEPLSIIINVSELSTN